MTLPHAEFSRDRMLAGTLPASRCVMNTGMPRNGWQPTLAAKHHVLNELADAGLAVVVIVEEFSVEEATEERDHVRRRALMRPRAR